MKTEVWHKQKILIDVDEYIRHKEIPPDIQDMPEYKRFMRTAKVLCKDIRCPCCGQLEYNRVAYFDPPV